jgi:hypothetical protein
MTPLQINSKPKLQIVWAGFILTGFSTLLVHLYEYFGALLGCSLQGTQGFAAYEGANSQYSVHKYMALSDVDVGYFIQQVELAAASFGISQSDITSLGNALSNIFGVRCGSETVVVSSQPAALQSICIDESCPETPSNAVCSSYAAVVQPAVANATSAGVDNGSSSSGTSTSTTSSGTSSSIQSTRTGSTGLSTGAAAGIGVGATIGGLVLIAGMVYLIWRRRNGQKGTNSVVPMTEEQKASELSGQAVHEAEGGALAHEMGGSGSNRQAEVHELHA